MWPVTATLLIRNATPSARLGHASCTAIQVDREICRRVDGFYGPPPHRPSDPPEPGNAVPYQIYDYLHGVNLRGGPKDKKLIEWLAKGDYIKRGNNPDDPQILSNAAARAIAWKAFAPNKDASRPAILTPAKLETVLTESGYGGLPVYVCRMTLAAMIDADWTRPVVMAPLRGREKQSGGYVGIYNPWNGSGDIQEVEAPMPLPPGSEAWKISGVYGRAVDECFGIVDHYYHADPKPAEPAPESEPEAEMAAGPRP